MFTTQSAPLYRASPDPSSDHTTSLSVDSRAPRHLLCLLNEGVESQVLNCHFLRYEVEREPTQRVIPLRTRTSITLCSRQRVMSFRTRPSTTLCIWVELRYPSGNWIRSSRVKE